MNVALIDPSHPSPSTTKPAGADSNRPLPAGEGQLLDAAFAYCGRRMLRAQTADARRWWTEQRNRLALALMARWQAQHGGTND
jgi:hypothetical protein